MGTSKSYKPTSKSNPSLGKLSYAVSRISKNPKISQKQASAIVNRFYDYAGGAIKSSSGKSHIHGKAGLRVGKNLAGLLSGSISDGLTKTLDSLGIQNLTGKSVKEVIDVILQNLCDESISQDDIAAKMAARQVLEELLKNCDNYEDFENILENKSSEDINDALILFYGKYLYESIAIKFDEKIFVEKGINHKSFFKEIKNYIYESTKNYHKNNDLTRIKWKSNEGEKYISSLFKEIIDIYGVK